MLHNQTEMGLTLSIIKLTHLNWPVRVIVETYKPPIKHTLSPRLDKYMHKKQN